MGEVCSRGDGREEIPVLGPLAVGALLLGPDGKRAVLLDHELHILHSQGSRGQHTHIHQRKACREPSPSLSLSLCLSSPLPHLQLPFIGLHCAVPQVLHQFPHGVLGLIARQRETANIHYAAELHPFSRTRDPCLSHLPMLHVTPLEEGTEPKSSIVPPMPLPLIPLVLLLRAGI